MNATEKLILREIIYSDIFNWPLRQKEILAQIRNPKSEIIKFLIKKKIIAEKDGFYFLPGKAYLIKRRLQREKWAKEKFKVAQKAAGFLKIIPGILLIGVSGSLAVGNVTPNDDIDFFIVCQTGTLWTCRFFSSLFLDLLGMRRRPGGKNFKDKICLNMFVDKIGFDELKKEKNIYTRHELQQLKIIWKKSTKTNIQYPVNNFLERILKNIQIAYMKNKRTVEKIEEHKLMFHPKDVKDWVIKEYQKRRLAIAKEL